MKEALHKFVRKYSFLRWLFLTKDGHVVIVQWPNAPLGLVVIADLATRALPAQSAALSTGGSWLLLAWASLEITEGVNPFRRLLGAVVAACVIVSLNR